MNENNCSIGDNSENVILRMMAIKFLYKFKGLKKMKRKLVKPIADTKEVFAVHKVLSSCSCWP